MPPRVTISTARTEPRKLLNISTVYWLEDENLDPSGLPITRMAGNNVCPPSTIEVRVFRVGETTAIPATFAVRRRFKGGGKARRPIHLRALQELEISLDPFFDSLPGSDPLGAFVLALNPPADALSTGPAGPDTGDDDESRPGNCGASDGQFDGLFRPVRLRFDLQRIDGGLEIRNLQNDQALPPLRGPHWTAVLHPDMSTGVRQRIMLDWKPDWIRKVVPGGQGKPVLKSRGSRELSMIVLHNTGGKLADAEAEGRAFPNGGASVTEFLQDSVKGIHYVVDVDGHVTKMAHELFGTNHAGELGQTPKWEHVGSTKGLIRAAAVGIEHSLFESDPEFFAALKAASLDLVQKIVHAFPTIKPWNLVGHSHLVKKPACPGANFPWIDYESTLVTRSLPVPPITLPFPMALGPDASQHDESAIYDGFFDGNASAVLRRGVKDKKAVRELQEDLRRIGFRFHDINGTFDDDTAHSVREFHTRFMNGARETPPDFTRTPPLQVNLASALQIKRVISKLDTLESTIP